MELDEPPESSANTRKHPTPEPNQEIQIITHKKNDEIKVLTKEERILLLVREHVSIKSSFDIAKNLGNREEIYRLLHKAQESQKTLQKLIPNKEIESYVDGWNPWTTKRTLFPPTEQKQGKKKSSTYRRMKYDDGARWAEVADILQAARAMYKHTNPAK